MNIFEIRNRYLWLKKQTAVRLGPIAHLRRAKFEAIAYDNQA